MFETYGALIALVVAIVLIIRKTPPAYALVFGALAGGLAGGGSLSQTVEAMISGTQSMMPSVLRILTSGVLAGALVKTGSAAKLADSIVNALGTRFAIAAVALATMTVTAVGVFVDIAVITVAPVALAVAKRANIPVGAMLVAMVGGGKAGNIISPNPNTIAAAGAFKVELTSLIMENIIPALVAFVAAVIIASKLSTKLKVESSSIETSQMTEEMPTLLGALLGPITVVVLLSLRPIFDISIDPLVALPAGGIVSAIGCGKWRQSLEYSQFGLSKVVGVAVLLVGTGCVAGIIKASELGADMVWLLNACRLPAYALAPISGIALGAASASTTAGVTIASQTFAESLISAGVPAISAAAMIHAGGTVLDALPHGSFFHATAGAVGISVKERLRLLPYGALVGLVSTISSIVVYIVSKI
ncbi:MAG: GntP family permease [Kiritimatiellae bacterium]|nr:GntP family permease [Kiritimatiellia bacterium]